MYGVMQPRNSAAGSPTATRPAVTGAAVRGAAGWCLVLGLAGLMGGCAAMGEPKPNDASLVAAQRQAAEQDEAAYNYSDAAGIYQTLYSQHPDDLELGLGLARNLRFSGSPQNEIALVNQLITKHGRTVPLLVELGKAYLAADQDNLALPTLLEAKGKDPKNWEILSTIGVAYDYQGDYADARDAYAQALIASPSNPTVLNNLALSQAQSGDLDGAIATLQQAIDQPSATAQARQNLALLMALKGDPDAAERLARKDLPQDVADNNNSYYRMLASASRGEAVAPAVGAPAVGASAVTVPSAASDAPVVLPPASSTPVTTAPATTLVPAAAPSTDDSPVR